MLQSVRLALFLAIVDLALHTSRSLHLKACASTSQDLSILFVGQVGKAVPGKSFKFKLVVAYAESSST
jgi:hypothetical protein